MALLIFDSNQLLLLSGQAKKNHIIGLLYYEHMNGRRPTTLDASRIALLVEEQVAHLVSSLRPDYLAALEAALKTEVSSRGRAVLEQLVSNAYLARAEGLPLCQDTGYVWVCLEVNGPVCVPGDVFSGVDAAVARAFEASGMRPSMLGDALMDRTNTHNNTPAFCEVLLRQEKDVCFAATTEPELKAGVAQTEPGQPSAILHIMLKGGGSDNASSLAQLPPSAGVEGVLDFVTDVVASGGVNACPPLVIGVGVGGTFDKVAGLAKHALLRPLGVVHPVKEISSLEHKLLARLNALDIGPGGLGGSTTALAVHIESAPCHLATLPVAVCIGCTALRSASITLA
ncbi:MAG: fumarate hydratase [Coriobacteriales bacterium]|jgi:tartrate/fumarate subfamily iron-sulfur-dependent hydro-lyase alpha chain|nr:fumarate hydratase [Coriobacteriales bacterium]